MPAVLHPSQTTRDSNVCTKFTDIYEGLPEAAKRALLEEQLLPLMDSLSFVGKMKVLSAAQSAQSRYADMPRLDLAAKKAEVDVLFDELRRDVYRSLNSSRREEITEEIIDSLVSWLSDIWQVVYEYGVDFEKGHDCLLFCCKALQKISAVGSGCKCAFMTMYVPVTIKDHRGTTIKHFSYTGAYLAEDAFLWVWRDMLLKMLADEGGRYLHLVPRILDEIQSATKEWTTALDRLLTAGGQIPQYPGEDVDTDYDEEDDDDDTHCAKHAAHWSPEILAQLPILRRHVSNNLFEAFKLAPSLPLYTSIISLAPETLTPLLAHLRKAVTYSGEAAAAALDIHSLNGDGKAIVNVLDTARPVFRPRDYASMQSAVHFLSHTKHTAKALEVVSRELQDCVEIIRGLVVSSAFGDVDKEENKDQLAEVMKLRLNTGQRQERVERWVDSVVTGPPAGNPLTFAAFLMGFPPGFEPEDTEEPDPFIFSGIKEGDPDYEDLRDEWRPRLKERFEGWVAEAETLRRGGSEILTQIASTITRTMPYASVADIVEEMISRIQDKPTKYHICDALDALSSFMKSQKRKMLAEKHRAEKRKKAAANGKNPFQWKQSDKGSSAQNGDVSNSNGQPSASQSAAGPSNYTESISSPSSPSMSDSSMPGLEALD